MNRFSDGIFEVRLSAIRVGNRIQIMGSDGVAFAAVAPALCSPVLAENAENVLWARFFRDASQFANLKIQRFRPTIEQQWRNKLHSLAGSMKIRGNDLINRERVRRKIKPRGTWQQFYTVAKAAWRASFEYANRDSWTKWIDNKVNNQNRRSRAIIGRKNNVEAACRATG